MSDNPKNSMNHTYLSDIDAFLKEEASELPPPDRVVRQITPWTKAIKRILIGMALGISLSAFTYPFLFLDYLLPTVGALFMLLGFGALKAENRYFRNCWRIVLIQLLAIRFPSLTLNATIWQNDVYTSYLPIAFRFLNLALAIALMLNFQQAFLHIRQKANLAERSLGINALVIWYIILIAFEFVQYGSFYAAVPMMVVYLIICCHFRNLCHDLDDIGYVIRPVAAKISEKTLAFGLCLLFFLGISAGYLFCSKYPMDWQTLPSEKTAKETQIKAELAQLGFPENVLDDVSTNDLLACEGATKVVILQDDFSFHPDSTEPDLRMTHIAVLMFDGSTDSFLSSRIFHHFEWLTTPDFCGTEALRISPVYLSGNRDWSLRSFSGQLLYSKDGESYIADYYKLDHTVYRSALSYTNPMISANSNTYLTGTFSFPSEGYDYRGYISYEVYQISTYRTILSSTATYIHQLNQLQYPVQTAAVKSSDAFDRIDHGIQLFPREENPVPFY